MPILLIIGLLLLIPLAKNAAGQPFVKNPLMPQLALGYVARLLRIAIAMMAVAVVIAWVALRPVADGPGTNLDGIEIVWPWELDDPHPPDGWNLNPDAPPPDVSGPGEAPTLTPELRAVWEAHETAEAAARATEANGEGKDAKPDDCPGWYCPTPGTKWADE